MRKPYRRRFGGALLRGEESQQVRFPVSSHVVKALHHFVEECGRHELKGVPKHHAIEGVARVVEVLAQKVIDAADVGLLGGVEAEGFIQTADEILGVDFVAEVDEKVDVVLVGGGAIEYREADDIANVEEELFEAPGWAAALAGSFRDALRICKPWERAGRVGAPAAVVSCDP